MAAKKDLENQKFVRVGNGAIYHHTEGLAARKDAVVVGPQEFADYMRTCGVDNDYTKAFPDRSKAAAKPKPKPKPKAAEKPAPEPTPEPKKAEDVDQALKDILGG